MQYVTAQTVYTTFRRVVDIILMLYVLHSFIEIFGRNALSARHYLVFGYNGF